MTRTVLQLVRSPVFDKPARERGSAASQRRALVQHLSFLQAAVAESKLRELGACLAVLIQVLGVRFEGSELRLKRL